MKESVPAKAAAPMALLWALGIASFLVNADNRAVAPVLPAIADDLVIRESVAGLLVSAYSIPYGLFQLVYGPIADRFGKMRTIFLALSCFSVGTLACSLVNDFSTLFILRMLNGTFAAGIIPIALAQIGDSFSLADRPKAISFFMSCAMSGQALGIVIGSLLAQFISWKLLFVCVGLAAVPAAVMFYKHNASSPAEPPPVAMPLKERYRRIFADSRSWILYFAVCMEGAALFGGFTYLGIYANRFLGLNYFTIGLLTACFSIAAFIGTRVVPAVIARVGLPKMPLVGACILTAAYADIWLVTHWAGLMTGFFIMGIGYSIIHTALQTYATELFPPARATCM